MSGWCRKEEIAAALRKVTEPEDYQTFAELIRVFGASAIAVKMPDGTKARWRPDKDPESVA